MSATFDLFGVPANRRPIRRLRTLLLALALAVTNMLTVVAPSVAGAAPHRPPGKPVPTSPATGTPLIMVHGWTSQACPGLDTRTSMSGLAQFLWNNGQPNRPYEAVSYYLCDTNGADITNGNRGDQNTSITVIAKQLAWWLYSTYSSQGQTVDVVGHSMGGLILRWALYRQSIHDADYPPSLLVQDAATVSAPHLGVDLGATCPLTMVQCAEMRPGSALIQELATPAGQSPQATGGTDWTAMGGGPCDFVPATSAVGMSGAHRLLYYTSAAPCYSHSAYLYDSSTAYDATLAYNQPAWGSTYVTTTTAGHSLAMLAKAIDTTVW